MNDTKIQIRISEELKTKFEEAVDRKGLDLSSAVRIIMIEFINGSFDIGVKIVPNKETQPESKSFQKNNSIDDVLSGETHN